MWWSDPFNEELYGTVQRLLGQFREHLTSIDSRAQPLVWGVGSAPGRLWEWAHPLLVVNYEELCTDGATLPPGRYSLTELRTAGPLSSRLWQLLMTWDLTPDTLIDLSGRPTAAGQVNPTDEVLSQSPAGTATVGVPCRLTGSGAQAFITAGHLVSGPAQVDVHATGSGAPTWVTGTVVHWQDPVNAGALGGYDYAVVALDDPLDRVAPVSHTGPLPPPKPPYRPLSVAVYGGPSRRQSGTVSGALAQLGDASRQWLNVWQFGPSGRLLKFPPDLGQRLLTLRG